MKIHLKKKMYQLKDFFRLYTTGLNHKEVERLLKKDAMEAFEYYKEKTSLRGETLGTNSFKTTIKAVREIFLSFLVV